MLLGILYVLSAICCTIGLVEVIGLCVLSTTCPPECRNSYHLLPIYGQDEDVELKLRWAANTMLWDRWLKSGKLILLNIGADEETLSICHAFMRQRDWVFLCTPSNLEEMVGDPGVYKTFKGVLY